jgi:porin
MKPSKIIATTIFLLGISLNTAIRAADAQSLYPYSGDFWTRSTLTGDWGGLRNELAAKGITLDVNFTQTVQGIVSGGKDTGWQYSGGRGDITVSLDTQKLGLWPGGFLTFEAEGNFTPEDVFRRTVNGRTGAVMPVNSNQIYPTPAGDNFNLPAFNFTQFLSPYFGLTIGKLATITSTSGDMNEFAHGKGDTQFMNLALNFNPVMAVTVPYSTLGTGLIVLPTKDPNQAIVSFFVLSSTGKASTSGFEDLNGNNLTFAGEGRVRTDFFGLTGHQLLGATFSNRKFTSLNQGLRFVLENRALVDEKGSWNVYYNFDHYLYQPKKGADEGIGIFGRFGASDGEPNFMHYFYSLGIGGKGIIPSRTLDRFGLGFYYIDIKSPQFQGLLQTRKFLRDEYGLEAFYNIVITPWMQLTPDIQIIRGAQKDKVSIAAVPPLIRRRDIETSTVLGLRLKVVF